MLKNILFTLNIPALAQLSYDRSRGLINSTKSYLRFLPLSRNSFSYFIYLFCVALLVILLLDLFNIFNMYLIYHFDYPADAICNYLPEGKPTSEPTDPVRYWPSGVPQGMGVVGSGLAAFGLLSRLSNCSPRLRVLGALGAAGASASTIAYQTAIENPVGFNRFMYGLSTWRETGKWPSLEEIKSSVSDKHIEDFVTSELTKADSALVNGIVNEVQKSISAAGGGKNFISSGSDSTDTLNKLLDVFFNNITSVLRGVQVEGYLDDLIGQQIIIHIILFVLVISLIFLFLFYIINNIIILNKDKILSRFENKYIKYYLKYQSFLVHLSLIYLPILIVIGLLVLTHGLYFLITHQIPYESLGVDLHSYVSSKK